MTEVIVTKTVNIPAAAAWDTLSSFRGIEKISPVQSSETVGEGVGSKRTCVMPDGAMIYESLDRMDDQIMEFEYSITEGPFPVSNYVSTVKISTISANQCTITWGCEFESSEEVKADMVELFEGFYNVIIDSLEQLHLARS